MPLKGGAAIPSHCMDWAHRHRFIPFPRVRQKSDCCLKAGIQNTWVLSSFKAIFKRLWSYRDLAQAGGEGWKQGPWKSQKDDSHRPVFCWKQWLQNLSSFHLQDFKLWKIKDSLGNRYTVGGFPGLVTVQFLLPVTAEQETAGGPTAELAPPRLTFPHIPCPAQQFFHEFIWAALHALCCEDQRWGVQNKKLTVTMRPGSQHAGNRNVAIRLGDEIILDMLA